MTSWFRYERSLGRWCPVVYHDCDKPRIGKGDEDSITPAIPVPVDCFATDGTPMFGRLQAIFPAPAPKEES